MCGDAALRSVVGEEEKNKEGPRCMKSSKKINIALFPGFLRFDVLSLNSVV